MVITAIYLSFTVHGLIFLDLYLTIRNPFYPRSRRNRLYKMISINIMMVSVSTLIYSFFGEGTSVDLYSSLQSGVNNLYSLYTCMLILMTIIPTTLVICRLMRKGTSRKLKTKICIRHLIYFALYLFILLKQLYNS